MPAFAHRHVAPRLVAKLAGQRNRARPPHLFSCLRVVRGDDARVVAGVGLALPAGDHLAVGDDRTGARTRALLRLHHGGLPDHVPGVHVHRIDLIVGAAVNQRAAPHRDVPVGAAIDAFRKLPAMLPHQIAGLRIDRGDDVARTRDVHHAVVDERRRLDAARSKPARPHHLQARDVVAIDLIERAVAPAVERAPPRQPVGRVRLPQHFIGDRHVALRRRRGRAAALRGDREAGRHSQRTDGEQDTSHCAATLAGAQGRVKKVVGTNGGTRHVRINGTRSPTVSAR